MFGDPGTVYVYLSYGMHWCVNIATGPAGVGEAVLLRGGFPLRAIEVMALRRPSVRLSTKLTGPGRLTQALGIDRAFDGTDVTAEEGPLLVRPRWRYSDDVVRITPRIGITKAVERPWRFTV